MIIRDARREEAREIAKLIMVAMNYECCQFWAGPEHTLQDFEDVMTRLVEREDSQYSYLNTIVAAEEEKPEKDHSILGVCVSYDGGELHRLREAFFEEALRAFGIDHRGIPDETEPGEWYFDSLAVRSDCRHQGIATKLLEAAKERARKAGLPIAGLLVDQGNIAVEKLYASVGFHYANDSTWGGHPMRHLICEL